MAELPPVSRRRFLQATFAYSAVASLEGCGWGSAQATPQDPVTNVPTHYLMLGDWGWNQSLDGQTNVAAAMRAYAAKWKIGPDIMFMLGDNFYGALNGGVASQRWQNQFENVYPQSSFDCPIYAVPGNHDYQVNPVDKYQAELAYAAAGNSRWTMAPDRYTRFTYPDPDPVVTFILLDSNMPNEPAQPIPPDPSYYTQTDAQRQQQLAWLTATLAQPLTTPFLFVLAHHPIYTNGAHGDNATLIRDWDPLLRKAGVHMYMGGHDHDLQHLEFDGHPTSFVLSGGGGADLNAFTKSTYGPYAAEAYGFTHVQISNGIMTVRYLDVTGGLIHKFTKTPAGLVTILK